MTLPMPVIPGQCGLETVRCQHQVFELRPEPIINQIIWYELAKAVARYGVLVHELVAMSNHLHVVLTDVHGRLPDLRRDFYSGVARGVRAYFKEREGLFSTDGPMFQRIADDDVGLVGELIVSQCAYTLANPVRARLVRRVKDWPGATTWSFEYGKPRKILRPETTYYAGAQKERLLTLWRPEGLMPGLDDKQAREAVRDGVREIEAKVLVNVRAEAKGFLGAAAVRATPRTATPQSGPGRGIHEKKQTVVARCQDALFAALERLIEFRARYREARRSFAAGDHTAVFPQGSWAVWRYCGARVEATWRGADVLDPIVV